MSTFNVAFSIGKLYGVDEVQLETFEVEVRIVGLSDGLDDDVGRVVMEEVIAAGVGEVEE